MRYEWDDSKYRTNLRKHQVSFDMATLVFEDPNCLFLFDRVDDHGEERFHAIGSAAMEMEEAIILMVVHCYRETIDGEEYIRIISARQAQKRDIRRYQEQKMDY